ncbi:hypothetical protein Aduo_012629 [Ancylostoma duodenale]
MLDNNFDHLSVVGLGIAMAFYNKKCIHVSLASVKYNSEPVPIHPQRSDEDSYNMALLYERAVEFAVMNPWSENMLRSIPQAKVLLLLPVDSKMLLSASVLVLSWSKCTTGQRTLRNKG